MTSRPTTRNVRPTAAAERLAGFGTSRRHPIGDPRRLAAHRRGHPPLGSSLARGALAALVAALALPAAAQLPVGQPIELSVTLPCFQNRPAAVHLPSGEIVTAWTELGVAARIAGWPGPAGFELTLSVKDVFAHTGATYHNPPFTLTSFADTKARPGPFPCPICSAAAPAPSTRSAHGDGTP